MIGRALPEGGSCRFRIGIQFNPYGGTMSAEIPSQSRDCGWYREQRKEGGRMTTNLLDACKGLLTPELLGAAASRLGESEGAVSKALGAACPLILSGLAQKSNDPGTMGQIINLLTNRANDPGVLSNPKSVLSSDPSTSPLTELGSNLLSLLFGKDVGSITAWLSEYAGLKRTSASSLLSFVTPLIMALLGDRVHREGLGASGLTSLLATQRDGIRNAVPAGLANIVGLAGPRAYPA